MKDVLDMTGREIAAELQQRAEQKHRQWRREQDEYNLRTERGKSMPGHCKDCGHFLACSSTGSDW